MDFCMSADGEAAYCQISIHFSRTLNQHQFRREFRDTLWVFSKLLGYSDVIRAKVEPDGALEYFLRFAEDSHSKLASF